MTKLLLFFYGCIAVLIMWALFPIIIVIAFGPRQTVAEISYLGEELWRA